MRKSLNLPNTIKYGYAQKHNLISIDFSLRLCVRKIASRPQENPILFAIQPPKAHQHQLQP